MSFGFFYHDKTKTLFRGFSAIENLYIIFYKSDLREHSDIGEHVGV